MIRKEKKWKMQETQKGGDRMKLNEDIVLELPKVSKHKLHKDRKIDINEYIKDITLSGKYWYLINNSKEDGCIVINVYKKGKRKGGK